MTVPDVTTAPASALKPIMVPATLLKRFDAIEVSVQQVDSPSYDYSGTSVLRGSYDD